MPLSTFQHLIGGKTPNPSYICCLISNCVNVPVHISVCTSVHECLPKTHVFTFSVYLSQTSPAFPFVCILIYAANIHRLTFVSSIDFFVALKFHLYYVFVVFYAICLFTLLVDCYLQALEKRRIHS